MHLNDNQWSFINKIALQIHMIDDITEMRRTFLDVLGKLVAFDAASSYVQINGDPYADPLGVGLTEENLVDYIQNFAQDDPFKPLLGIFMENRSAIRSRDYVVNESIDETDYYHTMWEPHGFYYSLFVPLASNHQWLGSITLFRCKDKGEFSDDEVFLINTLKEHMEARLWREEYFRQHGGKAVHAKASSGELGNIAESYGLTRRECEIIELWTHGLTDVEICEQISISKNTLKKHISNIFGKLEISSRVELLKFYDQK